MQLNAVINVSAAKSAKRSKQRSPNQNPLSARIPGLHGMDRDRLCVCLPETVGGSTHAAVHISRLVVWKKKHGRRSMSAALVVA